MKTFSPVAVALVSSCLVFLHSNPAFAAVIDAAGAPPEDAALAVPLELEELDDGTAAAAAASVIDAIPEEAASVPSRRPRRTLAAKKGVGTYSFLDLLSAQPVGLKIMNNCNEDIDLRTPDMRSPKTTDDNHQIIKSGASVTFGAGEVFGNKVVLAWTEARDTACENGIFCTEIELTTNNDPTGQRLPFDTSCQPNMDNQLAYNDMAIGAAFYKGGQPVKECPEPVAAECQNGNPAGCYSNAGRFDKCMHDVQWCNPAVGILVQLEPDSKHSYCLSPDTNKAVISLLMRNPTKEECAQKIVVGNNPGDWVCGSDDPKKPPGNGCTDQSTVAKGTTDSICSGVRYDIKKLIESGQLKLWKASDNTVLTPDDLESINIGGAKQYQRVVNQACGNQPSTQRATGSTVGSAVYDDLGFGTNRNSYATYLPDEPPCLDHAFSFEGDDVNLWQRKGQEYDNRGLFQAGTAGMQCLSHTWDTFVIKACPKLGEDCGDGCCLNEPCDPSSPTACGAGGPPPVHGDPGCGYVACDDFYSPGKYFCDAGR